MSSFRCGRCATVVDAGLSPAGGVVFCARCGHKNITPDAPVAAAIFHRHPRARFPTSVIWIGLASALLAASGGIAWSRVGASPERPKTAPESPADTLQRDVLIQNLEEPGDPELGAILETISTKHFSGAVPAMPVRWEPRLAEVGPLADGGFKLEGMFGHIGQRAVILLNPDLQRDPRALTRALCHEMVHAYLFATGDRTTDHGPTFQLILQRLSAEGAFEGIPATDEERKALRAWIKTESTRLDTKRRELDQLAASVERQRTELEQSVASITARGTPMSEAEAVMLNAMRDTYNEQALDANTQSARGRAEVDHLNREVARYNLMLAYPDGIDDVAPEPRTERPPSISN